MDKHIRESNLIEGIDDPKFDKQGNYAWDYLKDQDHLQVGYINKVQKTLTLLQPLRPDHRGYLRNVDVMVGGRLCPNPELVRHALNNWLIDMQIPQNHDPLEMHIRFEHIHPYVDGNGRTGRMLMWWHELKLGKEPTLYLASEKHKKYYPLFLEQALIGEEGSE